MRHLIVLIAIFCIAKSSAFAQFGGSSGMGSVWHYQGQIGIEPGLRRSATGWLYGLSASQYLTNKSYLKGNSFVESGALKRVSLTSIGGTISYYYNIYSLQETVFFNLGLGGTVSNDQAKNFWPEKVSQFNFGGIGSFEVEAALTDYLMFVGSANQRVMARNSFGQKRMDIGIGLKYLIN